MTEPTFRPELLPEDALLSFIPLVFLMLARVLKSSTLRKYRRHAAVGIVAFAAVITPSQDPYSLFFMAAPMYLFYEGSIVIGRMLKR